jgi:hypothetical protein
MLLCSLPPCRIHYFLETEVFHDIDDILHGERYVVAVAMLMIFYL